MRQQSILLTISLALTILFVAPAGAYGEPGLPEVAPREILIDIWVPDESALEDLRITLSLDTDDVTPVAHEVTIVRATGTEPWWSDGVIIRRAQRGIEVVHSITRIAWKVAIRVVSVPAIY